MADPLQLALQTMQDEPINDIDNLFNTIKDVKSASDKRKKAEFELQKEIAVLNNQSMKNGFMTTYDKDTNQIRQVALPPPVPRRVSAVPNELGGITVTEEEGTPPLPGQKQPEPMIDLQSEAVMKAYEKQLVQQANVRGKVNAERQLGVEKSKTKPLTNDERNSLVQGTKLIDTLDKLIPLVKNANSNDLMQANSPSFVSKLSGNKKAQEIRRLYASLRETIPFSRGGKQLTPFEASVVFERLKSNIDTPKGTIIQNLMDFRKESTSNMKLAYSGRSAFSEEDLLNAIDEDLGVPDNSKELEELKANYGLE